jgi:transcription factor TFIIIB component B''
MQQTQGTPIVHSRPSALRYSTPSTSQHLTGTPTPITPSRHQRASPARSVVSNVNSSNLDTEQRSIESNAYASIFNNALRQPIVPLPPNPPISTRSQSIPYIPIDPALLNHAAEQESAAPPPSENATSEVETLRRARPIRRTPKAKATEAESGTTVAPAAPVTKKKRARRPKTKDQDTPPENAGGEGEAVPTPQPSAPLEARTSLAEEQAENRKRASRKKRKSVVVEDPDGGGDQSDTSYNPTKKPKRSRKKVTNPDDPDADASTPIRRPRKPKTQEQIALEDAESAAREHDPTSTTMSDLTTDLPIGKATADRVSKIKKMAESRKRDREARFKIKEMDKLISFGKTVERIEREKEGERERERIENELAQGIDMDEDYIATAFGAATATDDEDDEIGFSGLKDSAMVPQVRMDASGNIVIDDLNMEVDRGGAGANDEEYEVVVERESDRFVNSSTHSKKIRGSKWTADETAVFYHVRSFYPFSFLFSCD